MKKKSVPDQGGGPSPCPHPQVHAATEDGLKTHFPPGGSFSPYSTIRGS